MKVLGISGSMRRKGNTAILVQKVLEKVAEKNDAIATEYISLADYEIGPCIACMKCKEEKKCVLTNDTWDSVAEKMLDCDVLVIGTPVYYYDVCGQMKNFIDRTYSMYHDRKLTGKYVVTIAIQAEKGADRALETLEGFANTHEFSFIGEIEGHAAEEGEILRDDKALKEAEKIATKIAALG